MLEDGRANQRYRTRKDLLEAAARLIRDGQQPTMPQIADEARVSRATAYRYFSNAESLLCEVPLDAVAPRADTFFADDDSTDPVERADRAERAFHDLSYDSETQVRIFLANAIRQGIDEGTGQELPRRQNRRVPLIEAALAPARQHLDDTVYEQLCGALALFFGLEQLIVFQDVLKVDREKARVIKSWGIRALIEKALEESRSASDRADG